mgnify:CR=1 FL=1
MSPKRPRVDREEELELLLGQAIGKVETRVTLVRADSGMGKSELLREFKQRCPEAAQQALVDFKGGGISLAMVFFHVCDTLGGWQCFQNLGKAIQHILAPTSVNVSGNMQWGQNEISVALGGPDEHTRDLRRADLTGAFISDLRALGRVVLILDTFEKCDPDLQGWIASALLPAISRSPGLLAIVAGQSIPEKSSMWECEELELQAIEPHYWLEYAREIGVNIELQHLEGCCGIVNGHCSTVAMYLDGLRGQS